MARELTIHELDLLQTLLRKLARHTTIPEVAVPIMAVQEEVRARLQEQIGLLK